MDSGTPLVVGGSGAVRSAGLAETCSTTTAGIDSSVAVFFEPRWKKPRSVRLLGLGSALGLDCSEPIAWSIRMCLLATPQLLLNRYSETRLPGVSSDQIDDGVYRW